MVETAAAHDLAGLPHVLTPGDGWSALALDYELGYLLEPAAAPPGWRSDARRPLARGWRFAECRRLDAAGVAAWLQSQLEALDPAQAAAGVGGLGQGLDETAYQAAVERVRAWIAAGDCYQVNFTFPLYGEAFGSPLALYAALRQRQPVRYGGLLVHPQGAVVSLSPELFLQRAGTRLVTRPMKGTAPRSAAPEALRGSEKDRAENIMIVDLLRNDLGRVARTGSVTVESLFEIEDYPTVRQMVSQIAAEVDPQLGLPAILRALFPCGSVTGAPKIRAMQIAAELERRPRRLYTGAFGWLAPNGDFRLNVAIRTLELATDGKARLGIGSGVVADSEPAAEWRECALKAAFLTDLDPGLRLIETLRCEDGVYPRLPGHLVRLSSSARWFGFRYAEPAVREALAEVPARGVWRVRLTLDRDGRLAVDYAPLTPEPALPRLARLAVPRIVSGDPLRRHKTTARGLYDAALADLAATPEAFDAVFLNERGEVAEGARSTVFVERDGVLLTPPLASGVLAGVLRAALLTDGRAREAVLRPDDLAGGFWLGNALRGLVWVERLAGEWRRA